MNMKKTMVFANETDYDNWFAVNEEKEGGHDFLADRTCIIAGTRKINGRTFKGFEASATYYCKSEFTAIRRFVKAVKEAGFEIYEDEFSDGVESNCNCYYDCGYVTEVEGEEGCWNILNICYQDEVEEEITEETEEETQQEEETEIPQQHILCSLTSQGKMNIIESGRLNEFDTIVIRDYSNYSSSKCRNGGNYGFDNVYHRVNGDTWEAEYYTTADFSYSCRHGFFTEESDEESESEIYSTEEIIKRIQNVECYAEGTDPFLNEAFCDIVFLRKGIEYSVLNDKIAF